MAKKSYDSATITLGCKLPVPGINYSSMEFQVSLTGSGDFAELAETCAGKLKEAVEAKLVEYAIGLDDE